MSITTANPSVRVLIWTVKPKHQGRFVTVLEPLAQLARRAEGHLLTQVVTPPRGASLLYRLIVAFTTDEHLQAWHSSADVKDQLSAADGLAVRQATIETRSGLEAWFEDSVSKKNASTWKTSLLMWLILYPLTYVFQCLTRVFPMPFPTGIVTAISMALEIVIVSYIVMPRVARILGGWLYSE